MAYGTINADVIQSSVPGVSLGAGNATRFKNRIINGAMVIDQRNAGASVTPTADQTYTVDRWETLLSAASKFSVQQQTSVVPTGFTNAVKITSLANTSLGATDYYCFAQIIEGYNIADLGWGTANAKTVTLSFWVQSSLTGTFGGNISNNAQSRAYPFTYSIPTANTWTQISVTIPGDTTGTWLTTTGRGIWLQMGLGVGTTYSGTAGSWQGSALLGATGATSVVGTSGATFYITGVQLEVGSSATGFEYVDYGTQLAQCYRYYQQFTTPALRGALASTTAASRCGMQLPVVMRTAPTSVLSGTVSIFDGGAIATISSINAVYNTANVLELDFNLATGLTAYRSAIVYQGTVGTITASAEL
jgi:hypothetical protein